MEPKRMAGMLRKMADFLFGPAPQTRLPERVRGCIVDHQITSEILVGWVQLALVLFWMVLYAVSPKTSAGTSFQPVPWALGAYLLFTAEIGRAHV